MKEEYEELISKQSALAYALVTYKRYKTQVQKKDRTFDKFCEEFIKTTRKYRTKQAINLAKKILRKEERRNKN